MAAARRWGVAAALALLALGPGGGVPFLLGEALGGLRGENARLEGTLRNLSRALGGLRARLRDHHDPTWTQEPPPAEQPPPCYRGAPPPPAAAAPPPTPPTLGGVALGVGALRLLLP